MKKILAIVLVLLLLAGCGNAAPVESSTQTPATTAPLPEGIRNVILIIGDGMGDAQIRLGELASGTQTVYSHWTHVHSNTNSLASDGVTASKTTDSAAGATALSTGQLTENRRVGKDFSGSTDLKNIMQYAQEFGKATGVVTTDSVDGATPAGFSAHAGDREDSKTILLTQLASNIDLFCANKTAEAYAMKSDYVHAGYTYISNVKQFGENMTAERLYCQLPLSGKDPTVTLAQLMPHVLTYLDADREGFVLMVEQAHVDKYCHDGEIDGAEKCANMLNDAVAAVLDWAQGRTDTAIIITADHETGGLTVSADAIYENRYVGPSGQTIYYQFTTTNHTPTPVSVYLYGFSPDLSGQYLDGQEGIIKNTSVFQLMYSLLENPMQ